MNTRIAGLFDFTRQENSSRAKTVKTPGKHASAATVTAEMTKSEESASKQDYKSQSGAAKAAALAAKQERRHRRRVKISAPVRIRRTDLFVVNEVDLTMTIDVSREGVLFETSKPMYAAGQEVAIVFPYQPSTWEPVKEQRGQVVRVARASEKRFSIAVAFLDGEPTYEVVDSLGRPLQSSTSPPREQESAAPAPRQLILVVDRDPNARARLRAQLELEGYMVETVPDPALAVAVLRHRAPAAIICEAEASPDTAAGGSEMSGYDLCVIVRRNPKYARIPVIMTTRSGLPSDFATAHALDATVCVAKPYDLDRVANLVRMFAPASSA